MPWRERFAEISALRLFDSTEWIEHYDDKTSESPTSLEFPIKDGRAMIMTEDSLSSMNDGEIRNTFKFPQGVTADLKHKRLVVKRA